MDDAIARQAELASVLDDLKTDFLAELDSAAVLLREIAGTMDISAETLDPSLKEQLERTAHRLGGSAGVFGFDDVGENATALEIQLRSSGSDIGALRDAVLDLAGLIGKSLLAGAETQSEHQPVDTPGRSRPSRITYVEDEPDIREIGEIALGSLGGFELDVCQDGYEAVARTPAFDPDLIILDVMMPGMNGVETFKRLRFTPSLKNVPIVFMTARVQDEEIAEYRALGCTDVITKPFDPVQLPDRIERIWQQANSRSNARQAA